MILEIKNWRAEITLNRNAGKNSPNILMWVLIFYQNKNFFIVTFFFNMGEKGQLNDNQFRRGTIQITGVPEKEKEIQWRRRNHIDH